MTDLDSIRTKGKKEVPGGTVAELRLGTKPGTVSISIRLPGQKKESKFLNLPINDGIVELPIPLVFISYALEDKEYVRKIADNIWDDGILTWLDTKDLMPGDNWKERISDAMERADFVLLFMSNESLSKTGFVQNELREALEQRKSRPLNQTYIIPILIEPGVPPQELNDLHWLNMWEDGAYETLIKTIKDKYI